MRSFPRTAGRRISAALLTTTLAVGLTLPLATADDGSGRLKDKQKHVQKELKQAGQDLHESSKRLSRSLTRLANAKTQLDTAREQLHEARAGLREARLVDLKMRRRLADAELRLQMAKLSRIAGAAAVTRQRESVEDMIVSTYEGGDPNLLALSALMDAQSPEDLLRQQGFQDVTLGEQTATYEDLTAAEAELRKREKVERDAKQDVAQKADEAAAHVIVMQDLESRKAAAKQSVATLVAQRQAASNKARKAKAKDRRILANLKREDNKIRAELARLARIARIKALRAARAGRVASTQTGGFLNLPVAGYITDGFGYRIHPIFGYWGLHDGVDLAAPCGAPLLASADGTVVDRFWSKVYGNRLVIDNGFAGGVGLATVYAHATSYTVSPGEKVKRGQTIGYVGSTGWSTGCHLHFTVMANGKPVDPQNWF